MATIYEPEVSKTPQDCVDSGAFQWRRERDVRGDGLSDSHLGRTVQLERELAELQARAEAAEAALDNLLAGVFTLAAGGRVLRANRKGEQILAARDGLSLRHDRLHCAGTHETKRLDAAIERAARIEPRVASAAARWPSRGPRGGDRSVSWSRRCVCAPACGCGGSS